MEEQRFRLRTAERTWTAADLPVLTASISLPEPVDEKNRAMRKIGWFYRLEERAYLRYCQTMLFPRAAALCRQALETSAPLPRCAAALNCRVTCDGGGLWSLTADMREQFGVHSQTLRRSDTWNLFTGDPLPLSAFFPPRFPVRRHLLGLAEAEISRQEEAGVARYHEDWRQELRRGFNRENFYLTPEGLCFYWQMQSIAPLAEGIPTFLVPYGEFCRLPALSPPKHIKRRRDSQ